jgi:hypothetical protein
VLSAEHQIIIHSFHFQFNAHEDPCVKQIIMNSGLYTLSQSSPSLICVIEFIFIIEDLHLSIDRNSTKVRASVNARSLGMPFSQEIVF